MILYKTAVFVMSKHYRTQKMEVQVKLHQSAEAPEKVQDKTPEKT